MAMDALLKSTLKQTIAVKTASSIAADQTVTYAAASSVSARVERDTAIIETARGDRIATTHLIITEAEIAMTSRVWLPGDSSSDATLARQPRQSIPRIDEKGSVHHWETRL